jgi:hypothetical protein
MSCHVIPCRLNIVIMCTKLFIIHFFFFILCLIIVIIMSLLNVRLCSSSHHTCHHRSSSVNFFFVIITLLAVCCYTTLVVLWDCYGLVCRFPSLCVVMKLRIKKSSRTFVIPAHTSLRSHVPAFMSPTRGISQSCEYAAHDGRRTSRTSLRSHSTCHSHAALLNYYYIASHVLPHAIAS